MPHLVAPNIDTIFMFILFTQNIESIFCDRNKRKPIFTIFSIILPTVCPKHTNSTWLMMRWGMYQPTRKKTFSNRSVNLMDFFLSFFLQFLSRCDLIVQIICRYECSMFVVYHPHWRVIVSSRWVLHVFTAKFGFSFILIFNFFHSNDAFGR